MVVRLKVADDELSWRVRRWAVEGSFRPWLWAATEPFEDTLLAVSTPGPLGFLAAFLEQDGRRVTPLLLLKNAVPLYEVPDARETDQLPAETWARIRRAVLLYNPWLGGCLNLFEGRCLRGG